MFSICCDTDLSWRLKCAWENHKKGRNRCIITIIVRWAGNAGNRKTLSKLTRDPPLTAGWNRARDKENKTIALSTERGLDARQMPVVISGGKSKAVWSVTCASFVGCIPGACKTGTINSWSLTSCFGFARSVEALVARRVVPRLNQTSEHLTWDLCERGEINYTHGKRSIDWSRMGKFCGSESMFFEKNF